MTTIATTPALDTRTNGRTDPTDTGTPPSGSSRALFTALATLARRRLALSARTPREIVVPLLTPILFAVVIAPALADTLGNPPDGLDYMTFVAISTIGLLVPVSCLSAGLGVIVDRAGGGQRDLIAAPVPRVLVVIGNLAVATLLAGLQLAVLVGAAVLRGAELDVSVTRLGWFLAASAGFIVAMYGVAETMANRIPTQEEYVGALPAVAIVPWFFAGSLFPIAAMPAGLTVIAKALPITHVLALMRYGLVDGRATSLRDIWGMSSPTAMAALSLAVVAAFALAFTAISVRAFRKAAVS
jgi:ABC-2 type transport system permease protein